MNSDELQQRQFRVGMYSSLQNADNAVTKLLAAGIPKEQITVAATNAAFRDHFPEYNRQHDSQPLVSGEVASGATLGATFGGLAAISLGIASGAVPLFIAGAAGMAGGSTMGGFLGAMLSKEVENDFSNLYHDDLEQGKILVAVVNSGPDSAEKLALAEGVFTETGSESAVQV